MLPCRLLLTACHPPTTWQDYILIDEIVDVLPSSNKPLHFVLKYSNMAAPADRILTIVCKSLKHAQRWVRALRLLRQAYARGWGIPISELTRLKSAFRAVTRMRPFEAHPASLAGGLVVGAYQAKALFSKKIDLQFLL